MPIADKVETYSVFISQNNYMDYGRVLKLSLESGNTAYIGFPKERPVDWLEFVDGSTNLYMTEDEFSDVYHLLQTESPVFFTALKVAFLDFWVGAVHTELDLAAGEPPGEGEADAAGRRDPRSLEALIRLARAHPDSAAGEREPTS